ncbi:hypothetical protein FRC00_006411 [Tulasnella sp. 408]|nr:hypothetical protein FRC00_006411 [Tulasnella sp. 408]
MDVLGYEEHLDYDIAQSTNPDFNKAIVRVNVFKGHRQTIQYIQPQDAHVLGQAELVIIDEAAAIPLPLVRNLIGPYLVFMASTISGYEGTGRSLSLKLIQQLRESTRPSLSKDGADADAATNATSIVKSSKSGAGGGHGSTLKARTLREIKLDEPIRYSLGDQIERWLNTLLCLDASILPPTTTHGTPHPSQCNLYAISRDTLFSFHPASELFLQRIMALYVSSHYKNSPNDLQLMSDAPAHQLFVLLPPLKEEQNTLPEPLVVIQVALEGGIAKQSILDSLGRGERFWKRSKYVPLYVRQTKNELTGECSCVMLKSLAGDATQPVQGLEEFVKDFRRRFLNLLGFGFREFSCVMALSVLEAINNATKGSVSETSELTATELNYLLTPFDIKRLESYASNMLDYHVIMDLLPTVAMLYFERRLGPDVKLSAVQSSILLSLGLQRKTIEDVEAELQVPVSQALALFVKSIRKICKRLQDVHKEAISATIPRADTSVVHNAGRSEEGGANGSTWKPVAESLANEMEEEAQKVTQQLNEKQKELIKSLDISQFEVDDENVDWTAAEAQISGNLSKPNGVGSERSTVVSVKGNQATKRKSEAVVDQERRGGKEKKRKKDGSHKKAKARQ